MIWLNSCPRCKNGAVYLDVDDSKHCIHCGFVQYRPLTPDFVVETAASSDRPKWGPACRWPRLPEHEALHSFSANPSAISDQLLIRYGGQPRREEGAQRDSWNEFMTSLGSIILIVDDAELLARVTDALERKGYAIVFADSEEAAMDLLQRGHFEATVRVSEFTFDDGGSFLL